MVGVSTFRDTRLDGEDISPRNATHKGEIGEKAPRATLDVNSLVRMLVWRFEWNRGTVSLLPAGCFVRNACRTRYSQDSTHKRPTSRLRYFTVSKQSSPFHAIIDSPANESRRCGQ